MKEKEVQKIAEDMLNDFYYERLRPAIKDEMERKEQKKPNEIVTIDFCHSVEPNHIDHFQEITVVARRACNGEDVTLIFTPEDWLDTFTPTMYKHVKEHYIKYIEQKQ